MSDHATSKPANPLWGGHYAEGPAQAFACINPSIDVDKRLYAQDIRGSIAHCQMLEAQKILTAEESAAIQNGLRAIEHEIDSGLFEFSVALEDIHMNIESRLKDMIGDVAGKLHTARSRNDQVATDFRLFVREVQDDMNKQIKALQSALLDQAEQHAALIMSGFTHLQPAQPVTFGHHLMAYVEMFSRDRSRLMDARRRSNECPLGAAALAGTPFAIDRDHTANALGFDRPMRNSLDAVSDRDFVIETIQSFSLCAMHLSRLAEELILWTNPAFNFITLPEGFTSGSSIMPQKRNPDAAELIRGKTGHICAHASAMLMLMKGLPLAYNKDCQEDKAAFFDAYDQLRLCVQTMTGMIAALSPQPEAMNRAAKAGFSTATDLADWLVRTQGLAFRDAHHLTGKIVALAEQKNCMLSELPLATMQAVNPRINEAVFSVLSIEASVASRISFGGTAPDNVKKAVKAAREAL